MSYVTEHQHNIRTSSMTTITMTLLLVKVTHTASVHFFHLSFLKSFPTMHAADTSFNLRKEFWQLSFILNKNKLLIEI